MLYLIFVKFRIKYYFLEIVKLSVSVKRVISPTEWVERQISTLKAVGEKNYKAGILSPKADPIARGIETEEKWAVEMKKAIDSGARKAGLAKTDMAEWAKYSLEIGASKLVPGVEKRKAKVERFVQAYQPALVSHLASIDALPEDTDSEREEKMLENVRGLKLLKGKY